MAEKQDYVDRKLEQGGVPDTPQQIETIRHATQERTSVSHAAGTINAIGAT